MLPWSLKPIFGYLFDQIMKKIHKTKYIIYLCCSLKIICFLLVADFPQHSLTFYFIYFIVGLCDLFINIICEYLLVLSTKKANKKSGKADENHLPIFFGFRAAGSLIGGFYGGRLINSYGNSSCFFISAFLPLIVIFIAFLYRENPHSISTRQRTFTEELSILKRLIFREKVFPMVLFVCFLNLTPSFDSIVTFYMTDKLKFSSTDLANFSTVGTFTYLLGLLLYSFYLRKIDPAKFFVSTNFILWLINVSFLLVVWDVVEKYGISNKLFCFLTQGVQSFVSEINFMPLIAIWCAICPNNLEATSITLFTGLLNLSYNLSNYFGSLILVILQVSEKNL